MECKKTIIVKDYHKRCIRCHKKIPVFNIEGAKIALYCRDCKEPNMIDIKNKKCIVCHVKRPAFNVEGAKIALYCRDCKELNMINVINKKCIVCQKKRPSFNVEGAKIALYCRDCKKPNMIDVMHKKCIVCHKKHPVFNIEGAKIALYCRDCKEPNMIDVINKRCIVCHVKHPAFNIEGSKIALYCRDCKEPNMIDVINKKCIICHVKHPVFNVEGSKIALYCRDCKEPNMINVKDKRCIVCHKKRPNFNVEGAKIALYCRDCKEPNMINVKHKKCIRCHKKRPTHGLYNGVRTHCDKCKTDDMVRNPKTYCIFTDCKELAIYGLHVAMHCEKHKNKNEKNLVEKNCKGCNLPYILDKYGLCENCKINHKLQKQEEIKNFLDCNDYKYDSYDVHLEDIKCGKERPDFIFKMATHIIVIEVDEFQHSAYPCDCELMRMINISQALMSPTIFIRYNPDVFKIGGKRVKLSSGKKLEKLKEWLDYALNLSCDDISQLGTLSVICLFYNGYDETEKIETIVPFDK